MIPRFNFSLLAGIILVIGSALAAAFVLFAPYLPAWGVRHTPHAEPIYLTLTAGQSIEQTFVFEQPILDGVAIWFNSDSLPTNDTILNLSIQTITGNYTSYLPISDISPDGIGFFSFTQPVAAPSDSLGTIHLSIAHPGQRVQIRYQIDATKYEEGSMTISSHPTKVGDIAWQFRYRRPALSSLIVQRTYALALLFSGLLAAFLLNQLRQLPNDPPPSSSSSANHHTTNHALFTRSSWWPIITPILLTFFVLIIYLFLLIRPGTWIGPSDFSKELSYVTASAQAFRALAWPVWSHFTCGGMSLLGNPEGTTLSLSTLLAILTFRPELSLWFTLAIEASLASLGAYLLARSLKLSLPASLLTGLITALSAVFPYKIVEGIVMIGGPVAFTPWVLLSLHKCTKSFSPLWAVTGGLALVAIFWRGDVHIIIGILLLLVVWSLYVAMRQRSKTALLALLTIMLIFFLGASVKTIPYLEQIDLINSHVDPHSAQITQQHLWSDIFLKIHNRDYKISVLHGLPESFGYFGAYVGIIPLGLVLLSLLYRHPFRLLGWLLLLTSLVLADGSLYEHFLRHVGPLSSLLRMPSRLLTLSTLFIGLLAGLGLDFILRFIHRQTNISSPRHFLSLLVIFCAFIAYPAYDLSRATFTVLNSNLSTRSSTILPTPTAPTLVPHLNSSPADQQHASILLQSGYLLPHVCGDQNNPPEFLSLITTPTSLSDYPATITPNRITLHNLPPHANVFIRSRFVSSWQTTAGVILAAPDQSIQLITPAHSLPSIELIYQSASIRAQQGLLITIMALSLILVINVIYNTLNAVIHWRHV